MTRWLWVALATLVWLAVVAFMLAWNHWRCTHRPPDPPPPADADEVPAWRREHRRRMR